MQLPACDFLKRLGFYGNKDFNVIIQWKPVLRLREGFNKKNIKSYGIFGEKKCFFHEKYKDDQDGLIHPEK